MSVLAIQSCYMMPFIDTVADAASVSVRDKRFITLRKNMQDDSEEYLIRCLQRADEYERGPALVNHYLMVASCFPWVRAHQAFQLTVEMFLESLEID
ncbi:MAG: hypothetical protein ABIQ04_01505 [Candidatus Saccharimonadales bacterium]